MSNKPVRCNRCNATAQVIVENNKAKNVLCPRCGESQSHTEFMQSLGEQVSAFASEQISRPIREWAKRDKSVRYKPGVRRTPRSRFRVDL